MGKVHLLRLPSVGLANRFVAARNQDETTRPARGADPAPVGVFALGRAAEILIRTGLCGERIVLVAESISVAEHVTARQDGLGTVLLAVQPFCEDRVLMLAVKGKDCLAQLLVKLLDLAELGFYALLCRHQDCNEDETFIRKCQSCYKHYCVNEGCSDCMGEHIDNC